MSNPLDDLAAELAPSSASTPVAQSGDLSFFPGIVTAVGSDGTVTATMNGTSIPGMTSEASSAPVVGDIVFIIVNNNACTVIGVVATAQSMGNGFLPGDLIDTLRAETSRPGWLPRDGSAVSRATYARLFAEIGTTYGVGNGTTTFNLPNDIGLFLIGAGGTFSLGATSGSSTVSLSLANLPAHTHANTASATSTSAVSPNPHAHFDGDNSGANSTAAGTAHQEPGFGTLKATATQSLSVTTSTTVTMANASIGSGTSFSILPPLRAVNRWIKT